MKTHVGLFLDAFGCTALDGLSGTGECICFRNPKDGFWDGAECGRCQDAYYGINCTHACPSREWYIYVYICIYIHVCIYIQNITKIAGMKVRFQIRQITSKNNNTNNVYFGSSVIRMIWAPMRPTTCVSFQPVVVIGPLCAR